MDAITDPTTTTTTEHPRRWRDVLPIHPAAELLPLMSADELRELADDIKENGLQERADVIKQDGVLMLLDGRNRLDALELLGRELFVSRYEHFAIGGDPKRMTYRKGGEAIAADKDRSALSHEVFSEVLAENPFAYVLSKNIHRRHLKPEEKRPLTIELVKRGAEYSNALLAEWAGVDDHEIAHVRAELESTSEIPRFDKLIGRDGKARPAKRESARDKVLFGFGDPEPVEPPTEAAVARKPITYDIGDLRTAWREVEAQAAAGNMTQLREAIGALVEKAHEAFTADHIDVTPDRLQ